MNAASGYGTDYVLTVRCATMERCAHGTACGHMNAASGYGTDYVLTDNRKRSAVLFVLCRRAL